MNDFTLFSCFNFEASALAEEMTLQLGQTKLIFLLLGLELLCHYGGGGGGGVSCHQTSAYYCLNQYMVGLFGKGEASLISSNHKLWNFHSYWLVIIVMYITRTYIDIYLT